jgi:hypothetical protein
LKASDGCSLSQRVLCRKNPPDISMAMLLATEDLVKMAYFVPDDPISKLVVPKLKPILR